MKVNKKLKLALIILLIVLVSIISFLGVYIQNKNLMENKIPDYTLGKDLSGYRMVELKVSKEQEEIKDSDTEDAENNENNENNEEESKDEQATENEDNNTSEEEKQSSNELLTKENYKKVKKIISNRLNQMQVEDYIIRQNEEDGTIILELPENDNTDRVVGEITLTGKFEILDSETNEVLMTNDDLKSVKAGYGTTSSGTTAVFLNIQFNKEGKAKFKDITNTYVQTTVTKESAEENVNEVVEGEEQAQDTENQTEEKEKETETITKKITIKLDDSKLLDTYFDREITNGLLQLTMGSSSNSSTKEMQENLLEARSLAAILNSGKMPIDYEAKQNKYITSNAEESQIKTLIIIAIVTLTIGIIYMMINYKTKGILAGISQIGYIAILLLAFRYFNVEISRSGILATLFTIAINYLITINILKENEILKVVGKWAIILIPVLILAITFTFTNILIGAVLFWGIVIALLYQISVNNLLLRD